MKASRLCGSFLFWKGGADLRKRIAGLLIIVLSVGALGFWELWGRENLSYRRIAVLRDSLEPHTLITEDMLRIKKVDYASKDAVLWENAGDLVGLETRQFVTGDLELHMEYFIEPEFRVGKQFDRYMLMVPDTWIMSMPESIRRGDRAFFYLGEKLICETGVAHVKDAYGQEITYADRERLYPSGTVKTLEIIVSREQMEKLDRLAQKGNRFTVIYSEDDTSLTD